MPKVSIVRAGDDLRSAFDEVMDLAGLGGIVSRGHTVLLKPNQHGGAGYTSPRVLRAAALWAFTKGAGEVWIGDGPFWALKDVEPYFEQTGLLDVCDETGARALNFHKGEFKVIRPNSPDLPETIGFSQYLYDADVVINLPVMKTHFNTLVTMGIKNLKGCLRPIDKKTLHEMELNAAVAEVNLLLRPRIAATVLDATTGYEGMGPSAGTPVEMGLLLASGDVVALDSVACDLMGIDPRQARLIRSCAERGVGEMDLAKIETVGENPADHGRRFQLPFEAMAADFPNLRLRAEHACSGCMMNLFRAMEIAKQQDQVITCETVVIGPGGPDNPVWPCRPDNLVGQEGPTLLVGNCTREGWGEAPHVPGCPPTVDAIREGLTGIDAEQGAPRS